MNRSQRESSETWWGYRRAVKTRNVDHLIRCLDDPDFRGLAVKKLGQIGDTKAVGPLARQLDASEPTVRSAAVTALSQLDARQFLPRIIEIAQSDPEWFVRAWAADAIGALAAESRVPTLIGLLKDRDLRVRYCAALLLARIGDDRAAEPLEQAIRQQPWRSRRLLEKEVRTQRAAR